MRERGFLRAAPSYLGIYPVTHGAVRDALGDREARRSIPELKMAAIFAAVEQAMRVHGVSPYHRFGVSDDDARNLDHIVAALTELKHRYPDNAFFVIDASHHPVVKTEVLAHSTVSQPVATLAQLEFEL